MQQIFETTDRWLSQTIALNQIGAKPNTSSSLSQSTLILVSEDDLITYGIEFFKPAVIKQTNTLYNLPSLLQPTNHQQNTLHIFVSTFRQILDTHHWKFYPHLSGSMHIWQHILHHCWSYAIMTMTVMESVLVAFGITEWKCIAIVMHISPLRLNKHVSLLTYVSVIRQL